MIDPRAFTSHWRVVRRARHATAHGKERLQRDWEHVAYEYGDACVE